MRFDKIQPFVRFVRFLELNSVSQYPMYRPYDARLFYAYKGCGSIFADGQTYEMSGGALLLIAPGVPYQLLSPEDGISYLAVNFDYTAECAAQELPVLPATTAHFKAEELLSPVAFSDFPAFNRVVYLQNGSETEQRLLKAEAEFKRKQVLFRTRLSALMAEILVYCARKVNSQVYHLEKSAGKMEEIISFIHENYAKPLSNSDIGEHFCFHPNYVNNMMAAYTGMSLHQYLLHIRIANAVDLLETTDLSVSEIACRVGFSDLCYFSKYFRKVTGMSPNAYRKAK